LSLVTRAEFHPFFSLTSSHCCSTITLSHYHSTTMDFEYTSLPKTFAVTCAFFLLYLSVMYYWMNAEFSAQKLINSALNLVIVPSLLPFILSNSVPLVIQCLLTLGFRPAPEMMPDNDFLMFLGQMREHLRNELKPLQLQLQREDETVSRVRRNIEYLIDSCLSSRWTK